MFGFKLRAAMAAFGLSTMVVGAAVAAPIEAYGRLPSMESVSISPDGSALALIATSGDERFVLVRSMEGQLLARVSIASRKTRSVNWADNDHVVVVVSSTDVIDGVSILGEQAQALSLNVRTGKTVQLPAKSNEDVLNVVAGPLRPAFVDGRNQVVTPLYVTVARNLQQGSGHLDLFRINLDTGQAYRQQMGDHDTYAYLSRPDGTALARARYESKEAQGQVVWSLDIRRGSNWQTVYSTSAAIDTPDLFGVSVDGQSLIIDTWDDQEKLWRPTAVSLADGQVGGFIGPPRAQAAIVSDEGVVLGFARVDSLKEYEFIEPRLKAAWAAIRPAFPGKQLSLESWTADYGKLVVFAEGGTETGGYYLINMATKRADPIGSAYPNVPPNDVAPVRVVRYPAADGTQIEAYLTLPPGRADTGLPLVVLPHGGPRARDTLRFDFMAQALASRGYAVLQPNFRGSTGYGEAFKQAGYGEWGGKMQTDLSDGVSFLAKQGTIDPKRACIMGASYGGYAALAGVTLQKGVYRCSVAIAGVTDLVKMMKDDTLLYGSLSATLRDEKRLFGVEAVDDPKVAARSPTQHAAEADAPVLLIHGKDDTVVSYSHSLVMQKALRDAGKPVELVTLPGEDHWLSSSATRLQTLAASIAFIEKHNPPN